MTMSTSQQEIKQKTPFEKVHDLNGKFRAEFRPGHYACPPSYPPVDVMDVVYALSSICSLPYHYKEEASELLATYLKNGWIALEILALACTIDSSELILFYARCLSLVRFDVLEHLVHMNLYHKRCFLRALVLMRSCVAEKDRFYHLHHDINKNHLLLALRFANLSRATITFLPRNLRNQESVIGYSSCIYDISLLVYSIRSVEIRDMADIKEYLRQVKSRATWKGTLRAAHRADSSTACYNYLVERQRIFRNVVPPLLSICASVVKDEVIGPFVGTQWLVNTVKALGAPCRVACLLVNLDKSEHDSDWTPTEQIQELYADCEGSPRLLRQTIWRNADLAPAATSIMGYNFKDHGDSYILSENVR